MSRLPMTIDYGRAVTNAMTIITLSSSLSRYDYLTWSRGARASKYGVGGDPASSSRKRILTMRIAHLSRFLLALCLSALASTALAAAPQPLPTIRGIVVDQSNAPVPGAVVSLDLPGVTTITAADGRFAIASVTPGKRRVRVTLAGFQTSEVAVALPAEGPLEELRITLVPGSGTQAPGGDSRWSFDVGIGFDNSISGNINSGAIGTLNNQAVVFTKNTYENVYGTGFHLRFGGGYMPNEATEIRGTFIYQSLGADLTRLGDVGISTCTASTATTRHSALNSGTPLLVAAVGSRDAVCGRIARHRVHRRDRRAARGAAGERGAERDRFLRSHGCLHLRRERRGSRPDRRSSRPHRPARPSLRDGTLQVDALVGTGLEAINDDSARWTIPLVRRHPHPLLRWL